MSDDSENEPMPEGEERFAALVEEFLAELNQPEGNPSVVRLRLLAQNPDIAAELSSRFRIIEVIHRSHVEENARTAEGRIESTRTIIGEQVSAVRCPQCGNQFRLLSQQILEATCNTCGSIVDVSKPQQYVPTQERLAEIGNFKILGLIGQGGFGTAYRAVDRRLGRIVAVKLPRAGRFLTSSERERFVREAKAAARLRHPNIVQVHEISTTGEQPYIVSDYIDGPNLAEVVDGQLLAFAESVRIMIDVARAVEFAHQNGIIHRDLKPANILLDVQRHPFVTDFGLARSRDAELTVTQEGENLGTPAYMSPEQAAGLVSKIDARSDVYSLGVILYRLICGVIPFRGSQQMQLLQAIQVDPQTPRSIDHRVPLDLETIALKAMAKEPERRYQTAQQLAEDMLRWARDEPILARRINNFEKLLRWRRRYPRIAAMVGVITCLLLVICVLATGWAIRETQLKRIADGITARAVAGERMSRSRLVKLHIQNGLSALESDRLATSMLWFAQALTDTADIGESSLDDPNRMRIAMVRSQMPILTAMSSVPDFPLSLSRNPESSEVLVGTTSGDVSALDTETNRPSRAAWLHDAPVDDIRHSADGILTALVLRNGTVVIRSSADGRIQQTISHPPMIADADFSPDGQLLATAGRDGNARVSSLSTGQVVVDVAQPLAHCSLVRFIDQNRLLAVSLDARGDSSRIQILPLNRDAPAADNTRAAVDVVGRIVNVALSADRQRFAAATDQGTVVLAESITGKVLANYDVSESALQCFLTHDDQVVMVSNTGAIQVRSTSSDLSRSVRFPTPVAAAALDPRRQLLAVAGVDGQTAVYVATTLQRVTPLFGGTSSARALVFSEDGRRISLLTTDGMIRVWDLAGTRDGNPILEHDDQIHVARFSPDGQLVATSSADGTARLWQAETGSPIGPPLKHDGTVVDCIFSHDGQYVATGSVDGTSAIYDTSGQPIGTAQQHEHPVQSLAFSPVETLLISGSRGGEVIARRVGEEQPVFRMKHPSSINAVSFSPDGKQFALAGADGTVTVWSSNGRAASMTVAHPRSVLKVAWTRDSSFLVTVCDDKLVRVFSPATSTEPVRIIPPTGKTLAAEFAGATELLTAGSDGLVERWNGGTRSWNYQREGFLFYHIQPSPQQDLVVASGGRLFSANDTAQQTAGAILLDSDTGLPLAPLLAHNADVRRAYFSPDQRFLLTGSFDGTARIWNLKSDLRPVIEIINEVEILSGLQIGAQLQLEALAANDLVARFSRLRTAAADQFQAEPEQVAAWGKNIRRLVNRTASP